MSQARHIGKIVLTIPPDPLRPATGTVLVTGGTGALGALVARHLVAAHGVRAPAAGSAGAARTPPAPPSCAAELAGARRRGRRSPPATSPTATRWPALLAGDPGEHPLTAVVHAAGVLDDGVRRRR